MSVLSTMRGLRSIMNDVLTALTSATGVPFLQQLSRSMHLARMQSFGRPDWSWDQECDTQSGLSRTCVRLIISLTACDHSALPAHLHSSLLLVPCEYILSVPQPNPGHYLSISNAASFVLQSPDLDPAMMDLLVLGGGNMIQRLCLSPTPTLLRGLEAMKPHFLIQKVLLLMTQQSPGIFPRDEHRFQHSMSTFLHIWSAYTNRTQGQSDGMHELISPCFLRTGRLLLHSSLSISASTETTQILVMLSTTLHAPVRPDLYMALLQEETVSDETHMRDLVTCMSRSASLSGMTLILAVSVVAQYTPRSEPDKEADRQAIVLLLTRMLCIHGGSMQKLQQVQQRSCDRQGELHLHEQLQRQQPEQTRLMRILQVLVEHFQNVTVTALTVAVPPGTACLPGLEERAAVSMLYNRSMTMMRKQPGVVWVLETMLRVTCSSSDLSFISLNGVVHMMLVNLQLFFCTTTHDACLSLAGTLRKLIAVDNTTSANEMRHVCELLISSMLQREGAHKASILAIVASILTRSHQDERLSASEVQRLINILPAGNSIRHVFVELLTGGVEDGACVRGERSQEATWERYAADLSKHGCKWLLPGCSSWSCRNLAGCQERALPVRLCGGCRRARYCSDACQRVSWVNGHRESCVCVHGCV